MSPIKTAILSFGMSGRVFHAPFIELHKGFELTGIWERSKSEAAAFYPNARIYRSLEEILTDPSIELVVVNTPTGTHFDFTKKVLQSGKHAVVEKAFTTTVAEAEELNALAEQQQLLLSVFQNRRWDSDYKTVKQIVQEGWLGEIMEAEIHFDRFKDELSPKLHKETAAPGAGIVSDLGPHLIDQAIHLFGMPQSVFADIRITRPGSQVDDYFEILLYYPMMRVRLKSGYQVREPFPSYVIHGRKGSFLKTRADVQETRLLANERPNLTDWGTEPISEQGLLHTEKDGLVIRERVPSQQGNYYGYYEAIYQSLRQGKPVQVSAQDGIYVMQIIEAARESSRNRKVIDLK
ncbi:MAG: Gfo/Idh/MocA family oxidoreductase [Chitinophagaceae bacterium]|nr:Gfo/Idh/MocA family oxidoreductase [Chitinophagaceae bacterium]MCA6452812.1 Gfo/Idh/MocA family oxidoreductase [Chitinophagaceae bacterium]MCA6456853.1 Gfo/Idh/MocA family oxidoreductase [Chitinophagaceae bacterium]MCA6459490.1 Gfo/Idh/MocA family oxidoreductase [Chitinophagaceae bacterium]MCA6464706.1 Gfo/Idh/MocA family oxidoreductase [Chitinophagaceae bacterium]